MDNEIDNAGDNMGMSLKKLDILLNKSKKGKLCCMMSLFGVVIILLFLIIYL